MLNLRSVDLNLLPVFEAVYEQGSLSRAAERLAMTQPAVSHAMTRLRSAFKDELFIRQSRGVVPTPVADMIYARLRGALGAVREAVSERRAFDPRTSERKFVISIAHPLGPMIAVRLQERLASAAPGIAVAFSTRSRPIELDRGLREGRVDVAVDWIVPTDGRFHKVTLFEDAVLAVARHGHPALRRVRSIKDLRNGSFVILRPRIEGENTVPGIQEWTRLKLNCALEVSEILEVFMVAGQSDLFGLIPRSMLKVARENFGLRVLPAGPDKAAVPIKLVWHESREPDQGHAFLRKQIGLASNDIVPAKSR
jgi:DNA-binding transcriptional LysR family regulator